MNSKHRQRVGILGVFWLTIAVLSVANSTAFAAISAQQMRTINQDLVPAFIDGDLLTAANLSTQLIKTVHKKDRKQIDSVLQRNGALPLAELAVTSRMELMRTGYTGNVAQPTEEEIKLLLAAVAKEISKQLDNVKKLVDAEGSNDLQELEDRLWKLHVTKNQLAGVQQLCRRGVQMARFNRLNLGDDDAQERDKARKLFEDHAAEADELLRNIGERTILLRIKRIELAERVLQTSQDFEERLMAAWVGDSDGPIVQEYFSNVENGKIVPTASLSTPGMAESAQANVRELRQLAGPELLEKSRHFFVGLHWWLRGRYGAGPHGFGLIKDQTAMASAEKLFGLYMPTVIPTPTSPYDDGYMIPEVDRRHHYVWMFEYRRLIRKDSFRTKVHKGKQRSVVTEKVKLDRFY